MSHLLVGYGFDCDLDGALAHLLAIAIVQETSDKPLDEFVHLCLGAAKHAL